jgi:hypothetical protein
MKIRLCDSCGEEIGSKNEFIKACKSGWNNKKNTLIHVGDICMGCWNKITGVKGKVYD